MAKIAPYLVVTKRFINVIEMLEYPMRDILMAHKTRKSLRPFKPDKGFLYNAESAAIRSMSDMRKMKLSARERRVVLAHLQKTRKNFEPLRKQVAKVHDLRHAYVLGEKFLPNLIRSIKGV